MAFLDWPLWVVAVPYWSSRPISVENPGQPRSTVQRLVAMYAGGVLVYKGHKQPGYVSGGQQGCPIWHLPDAVSDAGNVIATIAIDTVRSHCARGSDVAVPAPRSSPILGFGAQSVAMLSDALPAILLPESFTIH